MHKLVYVEPAIVAFPARVEFAGALRADILDGFARGRIEGNDIAQIRLLNVRSGWRKPLKEIVQHKKCRDADRDATANDDADK